MPFAAWSWPEFVNTVAQSLAALGTFLAVWVALRIANQDRRIQLLPRAILATRSDYNDKEIVRIIVTNLQRRTAITTALYWKIGILTTKRFYISRDELIINSSHFRIELLDGEQAEYDFAIREPDGKTISGGQTLTFQESIIPKFRQFYP